MASCIDDTGPAITRLETHTESPVMSYVYSLPHEAAGSIRVSKETVGEASLKQWPTIPIPMATA